MRPEMTPAPSAHPAWVPRAARPPRPLRPPRQASPDQWPLRSACLPPSTCSQPSAWPSPSLPFGLRPWGASGRRRPSKPRPRSVSGRRRPIGLMLLVVALTLALAGVWRAAPAEAAPPQVGQVDRFWVTDWGSGQVVQIPAVLQRVGEHCSVYVQQGRTVYDGAMNALVESFDTVIHPTLVELLGPEPSPGIDGDPRVVLLVYAFNKGGVFGYFYPGDIDPQNWPGVSNRREMISLDLSTVIYEQEKAAATAAHEFVHMICYYRDYMLDPRPDRTREAVWLEEGLAMYAEIACGYASGTEPEIQSFAARPAKNLTIWEGGFLSDYGAGLAFVAHLVDKVGVEVLARLVDEPRDGIAGVNHVLATMGTGETYDSVFRSFVVANYLSGRVTSTPPFGYSALEVGAASTPLSGPQPAVGTASAPAHGALYLDLGETSNEARVAVAVDGQDGAPIRAALISWDPAMGEASYQVEDVVLAPATTGGSAVSDPGYRRHTLAVWALGAEGQTASYPFRYSFGVVTPGVPQFLDVGGDHIFASFIFDLAQRGIASGSEKPAGSNLWYFRPEEPVTRAQFAKMVVEGVGLHTPEVDVTAPPTYRDVKPFTGGPGDPIYPFDYVEEASAAGIVRGYADGLFAPWAPITRIQLVRMILRAAEAVGQPLAPYVGAPVFADITSAGPLYGDVMAAYAAGITGGSRGSDGASLLPAVGRGDEGQVAKMLAQLLRDIT